ncbi:MAG: mechanosensitive ion channel family protein [Bacilli bacterium]
MKKILDVILSKEVIAPIVIIIVFMLLYIIISKFIKNIFAIKSKKINAKKQQTLKSFFINITRYILIIIAALMILSVYGIDTKAIIASLGVASLVLGLAFQDMIKDFIAGVSFVLEDTYNVGDYVTINSFKGEVIAVGMKTTRLKAYNGDIMIINNGAIKELINHSISNSVAVVDISIAYETNLDKAKEVLTKMCKELSKKLSNLKGDITLLGIEKLDDSAIVLRITAEVEPEMQYEVQRVIKYTAKQELDKNNIVIPYRQVVVRSE